MCIMMVMYRVMPDFPIVLAANRDEFYNRCARGPGQLEQTPMVWGGLDMRAGGTWLGMNEYGLVVGLTNRRLDEAQETIPDRRSRGLVCMDALRLQWASDVAEHLAAEPPDRYNAFNLLVFDRTNAFWIAYDGKPDVRVLAPGVHILANKNLNDMEHVRVRQAHRLIHNMDMDCMKSSEIDHVLRHFESTCGDHETHVQDRERICMHRADEQYGTVSSTILALSKQRHKSIYRYAQGHPCTSSYQDYSTYFTAAPSWTLAV